MGVIKYNKSNGNNIQSASATSGGGSGSAIDMNQIAEKFLPASPHDEEKKAYDIENEARFLDKITLYDAEGNEVTMSIQNGYIYINGSVVASDDVVSYGTTEEEIPTIEEYIASQFEANPTGTAQATITKLRIGDVIYTIQGSGGGGGGSFTWAGVSGNGNAVTSFTWDAETNRLGAVKGSTFAYSGSVVNTIQGEIGSNFADISAFQTWCAEHQDYVGSCRIGGVWYHIASFRHRNNSGDGNKYGWYLRKPLSVTTNRNIILGYQCNGTWIAERVIAGTDSNVASASKLASAINVWGQSLDGSADVSGDLSNVGNVTPSADGNYLGSSLMRFRAFLNQLELYGNTPYIDFHYGNSTADYTSRIIEVASGVINILASKVGIGVANPSTTFDVNGGIRARGTMMCDGANINGQSISNCNIVNAKQIKLTSPDGTKTRLLAVDNNGNLTIDGNVVVSGGLATFE